jgi:hypothetical protein
MNDKSRLVQAGRSVFELELKFKPRIYDFEPSDKLLFEVSGLHR